jgi:hypothetical protein
MRNKMSDNPDFTNRFNEWFNECRSIVTDDRRGEFGYDLEFEEGYKYVKLIMNTSNQRGSWAFVRKSDGDILKCASGRGPAKGSRGNIFDEHNGMKFIRWTGPMYLTGIKENSHNA